MNERKPNFDTFYIIFAKIYGKSDIIDSIPGILTKLGIKKLL